MKQKTFFILVAHFILLFLSPNAFACDNKSCENNYLISAHKYKNNSFHQATASQKEKAQYSANYKRQQIALVNVRRTHALNRARKSYSLAHLKQRRQLQLNVKGKTSNSRNSFNQDYYKFFVKTKKSHHTKNAKNILVASNNKHKFIKPLSRNKARKDRTRYLKKRESQRLANLKARRANTLEREKKEYAKNKQRRKLVEASEREKSDTTI